MTMYTCIIQRNSFLNNWKINFHQYNTFSCHLFNEILTFFWINKWIRSSVENHYQIRYVNVLLNFFHTQFWFSDHYKPKINQIISWTLKIVINIKTVISLALIRIYFKWLENFSCWTSSAILVVFEILMTCVAYWDSFCNIWNKYTDGFNPKI